MHNTVFLGDDGFIHNEYIGDQTPQTVKDTASATEDIIRILRGQGKPVYILIDVTKLGKTHTDARRVAMETVNKIDYDRMAVFGDDLFTKYLVRFILMVAKKKSTTQYFMSRDEAVSWLLQQ